MQTLTATRKTRSEVAPFLVFTKSCPNQIREFFICAVLCLLCLLFVCVRFHFNPLILI